MPEFKSIINSWYTEHKRDLPWRATKDPYKVWLSEIILQQTQVIQGLPYYKRFIQEFPTVFDLARASEEKVLKLWQGLGYYNRAHNLHYTAKTIASKHQGVFPDNYKDLIKLKGVGDYTASAIASICFKEPTAVLDGNVFRVLSRVLGINSPINSTVGRKIFKEKAEQLLDRSKPGHYNQGIMEFGALQCKPKKPLCMICPLQSECVAFQQGKVKELPVKLKKTKVKTRHLNYLVFVSSDLKTIIRKRTGKGIWKHLYEFPVIETERELKQPHHFIKHKNFTDVTATNIKPFKEEPLEHRLSHQKLMVKFWAHHIKELPKADKQKNEIKIQWSNIEKYPVPAVIHKFLKAFEFNN